MSKKYNKIVLLAGDWDTTPVVFHFLREQLSVEKVIVEEGVSRKEFLKKRIKKLGWTTVFGQVLFQVFIGKVLSKRSAARIQAILKQYQLDPRPIPATEKKQVSSVNSEECLAYLRELQPDLVIVHGTRIISKKILNGVPATFLNIHAGITPRYRGSHGAYWALVNGDTEHCGVTVHLVDAGIDTGNILYQGRIPLTARDNFATYPYLQLAEGLLLLKKAVADISEGRMTARKNQLDSALWHHPTIWGYLYNRLRRGIR
jgi:folate-dependent phosphoribosylglycinamide formyltransferase PurN